MVGGKKGVYIDNTFRDISIVIRKLKTTPNTICGISQITIVFYINYLNKIH